MDWNDLREWSDRVVELPFEFNARIRFEDIDGAPAIPPSVQLQLLETEFLEFSAEISRMFLQGRNHIAAVTSERSNLIPWLSSPVDRFSMGIPIHVGFLSNVFDILRPLAGQKFTRGAIAAEFQFRDSEAFRVRPIQILADTIELESGSLRAKIKGRIIATALAGFALLSGLSGAVIYGGELKAGGDAIVAIVEKATLVKHQIEFDGKIVESAKDQRCVVNLHWKVDLKKLREEGEISLNYEAPGLTPAERTSRVCNAQLVLNAVVKSIRIDGIAGYETKGAIQEFAQYLHLPATTTINDNLLRRRLFDEFNALRTRNQ